MRRAVAVPALLAALGATPAGAQYQRPTASADELRVSSDRPRGLERVGFDQNIGATLPLDQAFVDASGARVELDELLGPRPAILAFVYFECPMLCNLVLDGLARSLKGVGLTPGEDFDVIALSFDPGETPAVAAAAKARYLAAYGHPETAAGWHFLTGDQAAIAAVTTAAGFRYAYVPERDEFSHASGIIVVAPDGTLSRYFYGIEYPPRDVRLGVVEAADGKVGSVLDQALLFCFHYDPTTGKYGAMTLNLVRAGGVLTLLLLGGFVLVALRRERRRALARLAEAHHA